MAHFGWAGPGEMRRINHDRAKAPEITEPVTPQGEPVEDEKTRLVRCTIDGCGRKFKKNMIMARHFNSAHEGIREDKDTWREYAEEVWE